MINVVNKKTHRPTDNDFPVHRGTPLGNPYTHLPLNKTKALYHVETIDEAVEKCEEYLRQKLDEGDEAITDAMFEILEHAKSGKDVNLVCFCAGKHRCHGDSIKKIVEEQLYPKKINVGIIGSRTATNEIYPKLEELIHNEIGIDRIAYIVSGHAKGADTIGENFADNNGIPKKIFKPDWDLGRHAGFLRNTTIIENSDIVVCLWNGVSRGTLDSINKAKALNKTIKYIMI